MTLCEPQIHEWMWASHRGSHRFIWMLSRGVQKNLCAAGWRRLIGCLKLQVIFCKRTTNYVALLRKMTYEDKASYDSMPLCRFKSFQSLSKCVWKRESERHTKWTRGMCVERQECVKGREWKTHKCARGMCARGKCARVESFHSLSSKRCVAVCCSVLQCVAVCCSVLQCVAVHFSFSSVWEGSVLEASPFTLSLPNTLTSQHTCLSHTLCVFHSLSSKHACLSTHWPITRASRTLASRTTCVLASSARCVPEASPFSKL